MRVVVRHEITDSEKFSSMDAGAVAEGAPSGAQLRQFFAAQDASAADCLWEADSIDKLREYLDPATAGVTKNTYFEVDEATAVGLPAAAAAGA
jgi:hypothetical protein